MSAKFQAQQKECWPRRKLVRDRDRKIAQPIIAMLPEVLKRSEVGRILGLSREMVRIEEYRIISKIYREMKRGHGFE